MTQIIIPDWPAPANIKAYTTLRHGGVSQAPYDTFNLAEHVGDNPQDVQTNRQLLKEMLSLPNEPIWLEQIHSTMVLPAVNDSRGKPADASFTTQSKQVCVVLTADCLPLLLCHRNGTQVAAIHAGWRGLANGIIAKTLDALNLPPEDILAWLGPAIGPKAYELGEEIREIFIKNDAEAEQAFIPSLHSDRWLGDLYSLAKLQLQKRHVSAIYGGKYCTYSDKERFFSYRRDGNKTGRIASLIWMA